ncbi:isochorismatase [Marinosulfonomonas sp. PRT-SC04]|nr:isochorismatase [Marinosulfonomonas sp. PRT-SC04]
MQCALILIDFQTGFNSPFWGARNNPDAEKNAARLLAHWRKSGGPLLHIRHLSTTSGSPLETGTTGANFKQLTQPQGSEAVIEKTVNSAFIGTDLEANLRRRSITDLLICGLTTPHCVSTTARMAANLGFNVTLAHDACAAFVKNADMSWKSGATALTAQQIHDSAVAHLHGEFVTAMTTDAIIKAAQ